MLRLAQRAGAAGPPRRRAGIAARTLTALLLAAVCLPAGAYPADALDRDRRLEDIGQRLDCLLAELIEDREARAAQRREHDTLQMALRRHLDEPARRPARLCEVRG